MFRFGRFALALVLPAVATVASASPVLPADAALRRSILEALQRTGASTDGAALQRVVAALAAARSSRWNAAPYRLELTDPFDLERAGYDPSLVGRVLLVGDSASASDAIAFAFDRNGVPTHFAGKAGTRLVEHLRRYGLTLTPNDAPPVMTEPDTSPVDPRANDAVKATTCTGDPGTRDPGAWFNKDCIASFSMSPISAIEDLLVVGSRDVDRLLDAGVRKIRFWSIDPRNAPCSDRRRQLAEVTLERGTDAIAIASSDPDESPLFVVPVSRTSDEENAAACLATPVDCYRLSNLYTAVSEAPSEADAVALIEDFVAEVGLSDGFPIRCGGTTTFFYRAAPESGAPSIVGDFDGWDSSAGRMTLLAGTWYHRSFPIDPASGWTVYKVTDGTSFLGDPHARRFGYDAYGEYSLVSGAPDRAHLERYRDIAGGGLGPRDLVLYLPAGYVGGTSNYPVLYAQDGQNLFDPGAPWGGWHLDQAIESLLAEGTIQPLIVVGIHATAARTDEYTHVQDTIGGVTCGGQADAYFDLIVSRIMPLVGAHYRVRTGPASTWSLGSSLGGVTSLYFGMKHPDVFGRVAGMSSSAGWGSIAAHNQTLIELLPTLGKPAAVFYLDSGGGDGGAPGCVDADGDGIDDDDPASSDDYCENAQLRGVFAAQGYVQGTDLFYVWEPGAQHNEAAWAARVTQPLAVLAAP